MSAENRKPRFHRLERVFVHSPIYFVTACTHERRKILASAKVHETFLDFARRGPEYGAWVGAYVIMPDHLLRSGESYSEKWSYVRENPIRAGLVSKTEDWPFMGEIFALEYHPE